jgi:hypothetical protein
LITFKFLRSPFVTLKVANCGWRIYIEEWVMNLLSEKIGDLVPSVPPLLAEPMECAPFGIVWSNDCDIFSLNIDPGDSIGLSIMNQMKF